jgi:hypothetical protein
LTLKKGLGLALICAAALATAAPALAGSDDKPQETSKYHDSSSPSLFAHKHGHHPIGRRRHKPLVHGAYSGKRVHKPMQATGLATGKRQH